MTTRPDPCPAKINSRSNFENRRATDLVNKLASLTVVKKPLSLRRTSRGRRDGHDLAPRSGLGVDTQGGTPEERQFDHVQEWA